ncbi:hypothetical protein L6232_24685, partial [Shewanella sp. C31]|nr:hypothetical protein [Shewanella electrica]
FLDFTKMINIVSRSGNIAPHLRGTSQAVATHLKTLTPPVVGTPPVLVPSKPEVHSSYSLSKILPSGNLRISSGPAVSTQVRFAHTDL